MRGGHRIGGVALAVLAMGAQACSSGGSGTEQAPGVSPPGERARPDKRILFGDLHVHTTYSWDAFLFSLPISGGEGAHPPDDACDFARYCAGLDFFALTDHAESLLPEHWTASKQSIRRCNARAGDPSTPELVAFMGFEWSQMASTAEAYYGHRCVVFAETEDDELPARPIGAGNKARMFTALGQGMRKLGEADRAGAGSYLEFARYLGALSALAPCAEGVDSPRLPAHCQESAATPAALHQKLDQWGYDALVIPHGMAWGIYAPGTASIANQLNPKDYDPKRQRLIELMSGHGNAEQFRPWRAFERDPDGTPICPAPSSSYLPCCWQAGELVRARCGDLPESECQARVEGARRQVMESYDLGVHRVVPEAGIEALLDCGQCRDCFKPSFSHRPRESVQYAMALVAPSSPEAKTPPLRFRYGFIASSDGHSARPGTGYKQIERMGMMTDASPPAATPELARLRERSLGPVDRRVDSFLYPGGLVAVHAAGRHRAAIWEALKRREVYGTSGPRILLYFDLLNADRGRVPMGSAVTLRKNPVFEVRAVGSFVQTPGCPAGLGLGPERLERLCRNQCYRPSDQRRRIERIEVIRIHPQRTPDEPVEPLIEDPWLVLPCPPDPGGCVVRFEDPGYLGSGRDALYYVRALEAESPAINGDPLRTRFDSSGRPTSIRVCGGRGEDGSDPDCLAPVMERAWSSPIFVDQPLE